MVQSQSPELFDWVIMFSIDLIIFFVHTGEEEVGSTSSDSDFCIPNPVEID